ncbi:MAG: DNA cytosine methyltransferase [Eubacterium sp.]
MDFIDICAGIGGFRLGLEMAGHTCIGFVERDKFAVKSYKAMYDTKGEWFRNDVTKITSEEVPRADMWCFGFPCQDISVAGKQIGINGKRSGVYFDIIKLIKGKKENDRPEWILVENVKNLLSIDKGGGFAGVLSEMDEIGYDIEWQVLNSKNFGVPQNRERVYIIGHLRSRGRRKIFPVEGENTGSIKQIGSLRSGGQRGRVHDISGISPTLNASDYKGAKLIQVIGGSQGERVYDPSGVSVTLSSNGGGLGAKTGLYFVDSETKNSIIRPVLTPEKLITRQNGRRMKEDGEPMFTLTAQDRHGIYDGTRIRRLTPKECFRLQGFPDELFEKAAILNSDTQLYKQAGNAVTVNVVYEIGKRLY